MKLNETSIEFLRSILSYNKDSGVFHWKHRSDVCKSVNSKMFGRVAGSPTGEGYIQIMINRRYYPAHRVAWAMMTGKWPAVFIDHIDGDVRNNAFGNLREATRSQNGMNRGAQMNNLCGIKGVSKLRGCERWRAQIKIERNIVYLGCFTSPELAGEAYAAASRRLHKEFSEEESRKRG